MKSQVYGGFFAALFSLLILRASSSTTEVVDVEDAEEYCTTCVKVDSICYNRTYLFELTAPFRQHVVIKEMGILRDNNVLYYSFEPKLEDPEYSKVASVSLDSPDTSARVIHGNDTFNFTVFDINQNDKNIFLGGSDGIWIIRRAADANSQFNNFICKGDTITNVVSKDYVYFTKANTPGIFKNKDGVFVILLEDKIIYDFVLDKDVEYTIVYLHNTGLSAFNSKTQEDIGLSKNPFFRGLSVDLDGVVYAWYVDGIYKVTLDSVLKHSKVRKISDIKVGAMTFDNLNNIVYTNEKSLYKLTKTNTTKC